MEKYVLEALFRMNEPSFALERMKQRYTKMMNYPEYTTLFEGWGIGPDGFGGGTINHAWSGGPLTLLSQKVCGIEPTSPGFRSFKVCPQMGTLTEASAAIDTHFGKIEVSLKRKGKRYKSPFPSPKERPPKSSGPTVPERISLRGVTWRNRACHIRINNEKAEVSE